MKGQRMLPYVFLLFLLLVFIFIIGVRYGKKVEQANKTINYLLSIPPSKPPLSPTPLKYLTYSNKTCGVQFLYPSFLKPAGETSKSAVLKENSTTSLQFSCDKESGLAKILKDPKVATAEITFKSRKTEAKKKDGLDYFSVRNPNNGLTIYIMTDANLLPLVDSSFQFLSY